jgi:hypothetical protein
VSTTAIIKNRPTESHRFVITGGTIQQRIAHSAAHHPRLTARMAHGGE